MFLLQELHAEEAGVLRSQVDAAREEAAAEQQALQDRLAEGTAREEELAELQSAVTALEASLGESIVASSPSQTPLDFLRGGSSFISALIARWK